MAALFRKGIALVLVVTLFAGALPAIAWGQDSLDLNGYTIGGGSASAGAAGTGNAALSGSNIFAGGQPALQNDFNPGMTVQQSVPNLATQQSVPNLAVQQTVPNLAVQQNAAGSELRSDVSSTGMHVIRWSGGNISVQVDGITATNGVTPVRYNSEITVSAGMATESVSTCVAEYSLKYKKPYETEATANDPVYLSLQSGSATFSVCNYESLEYGELLTDVVITVNTIQTYPIWVAGEPITDDNRNNIIEGIGGTVAYNPETNTLLLNNAVIDGGIVTKKPLNILFAGENLVSGFSGTGCGIYSNADLTLSAYSTTDILTVTAQIAEESCAIKVENGNLRIWNDTNVTAYSQGGTALSTGVYVSGLLEVSGKLSAAGGSAADSCGILCNAMTVKTVNSAGGGAVAAYGGDCYSGGSSTGVRAAGNVTVEYLAALAAAGKGASESSRGIWTDGSFANNGTADCSAGSGGSDSTGLFANSSVSNGGTLSAKGGTSSGGTSCGIASNALMMTGGAIDAHAVQGAKGSVGIFAPTTISGGEVIAEGAGGAFSATPAFSGYTPMIRVSDLSSDAFEADSSDAGNYKRKYVFITSRVLSASPADITINVGETRTLSAEVPAGYSLRWYCSNSMVAWVDELMGTVTGRTPGSAIVTVKAYNAHNAQVSEASCRLTVKAEEKIPITAIRLDQENVTLTSIPGLRTVKYWFMPNNATEKEVMMECSDAMRSVVRVDLSPEDQSFQITPVANGTAMITLTAKSGAKAYCKVTVNGIGKNNAGERISYAISYMDNNGVWYYDRSDSFTVKTTAPATEYPRVEIDGVVIPETTGAQRNWTWGAADRGTAIVFTRPFMASLYHANHTFSVTYTAVGKISRPFRVQSVRDWPKTGDTPLAPMVVLFLFSGMSAAGTLIGLRRKKNGRAG